MTPSQHRVHHGTNPEYIDKNLGVLFSFWDRIFGSYVPERVPVRYGITEVFDQRNVFWVNFFPWISFATRARSAFREGRGAAYLIGRYQSEVTVPDPYSDFPEVTERKGFARILHSAPYFYLQSVFLMGIALYAVLVPASFPEQVLTALFIFASFGWLGLLLDRKRVPLVIEGIRITGLIVLLAVFRN